MLSGSYPCIARAPLALERRAGVRTGRMAASNTKSTFACPRPGRFARVLRSGLHGAVLVRLRRLLGEGAVGRQGLCACGVVWCGLHERGLREGAARQGTSRGRTCRDGGSGWWSTRCRRDGGRARAKTAAALGTTDRSPECTAGGAAAQPAAISRARQGLLLRWGRRRRTALGCCSGSQGGGRVRAEHPRGAGAGGAVAVCCPRGPSSRAPAAAPACPWRPNSTQQVAACCCIGDLRCVMSFARPAATAASTSRPAAAAGAVLGTPLPRQGRAAHERDA